MDGNLPNLPDLPLRLIEDGLIAKVFIDPSRDSSSHSTSSRRDQVGNKGENDNLFSWAPARAWARQLTDHSVAGYRSVTRPIFFSFFFLFFFFFPLSPVAVATSSYFGRAPPPFLNRPVYTGRCSLKFFPCSRERYPHETCVDAFFKPPHNRAGRGQAVVKKKGRKGVAFGHRQAPDDTTTKEA